MEHRADDDRIVVRLNPGEEVIESLKELREIYDIEGAFFSGIGAVDRVTIGHYDVGEQDYR
ncbi:MAG: PPC domain-containing DNA-binding protein, partial [Candidatus Nanohaloarchaea archaeon]|nr:PPC domain-containing DNA-binding protein [Candidatus Nanohaloarchaea archaeon]